MNDDDKRKQIAEECKEEIKYNLKVIEEQHKQIEHIERVDFQEEGGNTFNHFKKIEEAKNYIKQNVRELEKHGIEVEIKNKNFKYKSEN